MSHFLRDLNWRMLLCKFTSTDHSSSSKEPLVICFIYHKKSSNLKSKAHREPSDHRNNTTPFPFSGFVIRISRIWRGQQFRL
ncbi:hypothetical protein CMV_003390 [Castanea mollissima]|uniref:Uncharacterized protein n=1 Tax=Castanea mollissima TaxID=60419 RepID=A0A8J4RUL7_9ROSI|nr:hypothetical protein CMV_003390 [Castanea mollissima]